MPTGRLGALRLDLIMLIGLVAAWRLGRKRDKQVKRDTDKRLQTRVC